MNVKNTFIKAAGLFAFALLGFANSAYAQPGVTQSSTASATASAVVVTPILITFGENMQFGNINIGTGVGSVELPPAATPARDADGSISLPAIAGTVTAARFVVTGAANYTYAITLPSTLTLTQSSGSDDLVVNNFTSLPAGTGTLSGTGSQTVYVGATLNASGNESAGTYNQGGGFNVIVNYN